MFGEDRFGDNEDFFATYAALGGMRLDRAVVDAAIRRCYRAMAAFDVPVSEMLFVGDSLRLDLETMPADMPVMG